MALKSIAYNIARSIDDSGHSAAKLDTIRASANCS